MNKWKILSKKTVYKGKLFNVEEQKVVLPNGKERTYSTINKDPVVIVFPINSSYELYLSSQYRYLHDEKILEAVAGYIDKGESPLLAAKRELKEEAGLIGSHWEELARLKMASSVIKSTTYLFLVKDLEETESEPDEGEYIKIIRVSLKDAVSKVLSGEITTSSTIAGILILNELKKQKKL